MTVSFDELSGRQLDALVALRVLGLEVLETSDLDGEKEWDHNARRVGRGHLWVPVPRYSTDPSASLKLSGWLKEQGWKVTVTASRAVVLAHPKHDYVEAKGAQQYEALCRAALKAMEI